MTKQNGKESFLISMTVKHPERIYFGQLVRALREEHSLRKGMPLSPDDLADRINWTKERVGAMERGEIRHVPPDILLNLGEAFSLTTREKDEFLQAYTFHPKERYLDPNAPENRSSSRQIIHELHETVANLMVPAFVINPIGELLIVNGCCLNFFRGTQAEAKSQVGKNILSIVFGMAEKYRAMGMSDSQWYEMAVKTTGTFRGLSLQYRATPDCKHLLEYLDKLSPRFSWCWRGSYLQQIKETNIYHLILPDRETHIAYFACNTTLKSRFGPVTLVQYQPVNKDTQRLFETLTEKAANIAYDIQAWHNPFYTELRKLKKRT